MAASAAPRDTEAAKENIDLLCSTFVQSGTKSNLLRKERANL